MGYPAERIAEDYLRILRYFRFYGRIAESENSWDPSTLAAIDNDKTGLDKISRERIWLEIQRIVVGNHVSAILSKMREIGLFPLINLDAKTFSISSLVEKHGIAHLPSIRPVTILSYAFSSTEPFSALRKDWKMSGDEEYIGQFVIKHRNKHEEKYFKDLLVDTPKHCRHKFHMGFKELSLSRGSEGDALLKSLSEWNPPQLPLRGDQVIKRLGLPKGPLVHKYYTLGKTKWKESC